MPTKNKKVESTSHPKLTAFCHFAILHHQCVHLAKIALLFSFLQGGQRQQTVTGYYEQTLAVSLEIRDS